MVPSGDCQGHRSRYQRRSGLETEYYQIVDAASMQPIGSWDEAASMEPSDVTVYCGGVRLIDNIRY